MEQAVESMKAGNSFLAFPEGTRSPDGRLQTFKKGLFVMAIKAGALIVPSRLPARARSCRKASLRFIRDASV